MGDAGALGSQAGADASQLRLLYPRDNISTARQEGLH